jgi:probable rRNA maturation factor
MTSESRYWLCEHATAALRVLGCLGEVRARVVNDAEMAAAHEKYSGVPGTTDVLTFDLRDDPGGGGPLDTDILVCIDEARRQAAARGLRVERELLLYIVHGVLHCLGFDDHDGAGAAAMHAEEDRVLEAIGVGRTFESRAAGGFGR